MTKRKCDTAPIDALCRATERDNEFLRDQVKKKDEQITDLSKRFGETQTLLGAMQRMLAPLLGQADPFHAADNRNARRSRCLTYPIHCCSACELDI